MTDSKSIIIMSTYNGKRFIKQQLDSLLNQTYPSDILIRDDGSNDGTLAILDDYAARFTCIHLHHDTLNHLGLRKSYFILLQEAIKLSPDVICYADQDDIWFTDKTEKLLKQLLTADQQKPALVFSDVVVVDENLNLIHSSLSALQKLENHKKFDLKKLLFYCPALGCTIMLNKPLFKLISSMPDVGNSLNPDKWAIILAHLTGRIIYLSEPTLKYRQHANNTVGALLGIKRKIWTSNNLHFLKCRYQVALEQAQDIKTIPFLSLTEKTLLDKFIKLFAGNYFYRIRYFFIFALSPPNWKRKLGLMFSLFLKFSQQERI